MYSNSFNNAIISRVRLNFEDGMIDRNRFVADSVQSFIWLSFGTVTVFGDSCIRFCRSSDAPKSIIHLEIHPAIDFQYKLIPALRGQGMLDPIPAVIGEGRVHPA